MKTLLKIASFAGLLLMVGASLLVFSGRLSRHGYFVAAFIGTVVWFATVPFWMKRRLRED